MRQLKHKYVLFIDINAAVDRINARSEKVSQTTGID